MMALVGYISFLLGKGQVEMSLDALSKEVESLKAEQKEAAVVKRVSQQMEEIAYQQKAVSDKQRDKAEASSQLALAMRDKAEQESRAAREAEGKAKAALNEAEVQRANAVQQERFALAERDKATLSKTIADTLHIRTQAHALGTTSVNLREIGDYEVSDILAYASWYFLNNYRGNTYYDGTFKALSLASEGTARYMVEQRGSVNGIAVVPGKPGTCVVVTNYGEIELFTPQAGSKRHKSTVLLQDSRFDFRDVWAGRDAACALSFNSQLCVVDYNGKLNVLSLPEGQYIKMIPIDANTLLLAARRSLCFYTLSSGQVSQPVLLPKTLSTLVKREKQVCLFYTDGSYAEMDGSGKLTPRTPLVSRIITAAHYASDLECLCLGLKEGTVLLLNKYNRVVEILDAHKSRPQSITTMGSVMVSGAYDKAAYIWKLDNLLFQTGLTFWQEMQAPTVPAAKPIYKGDHVPGEWISPVEYIYKGWILSVCADKAGKAVWIGTSTGEIVWQDISADDMALQVRKKMKRNLTSAEWLRYLGISVPYVQFK